MRDEENGEVRALCDLTAVHIEPRRSRCDALPARHQEACRKSALRMVPPWKTYCRSRTHTLKTWWCFAEFSSQNKYGASEMQSRGSLASVDRALIKVSSSVAWQPSAWRQGPRLKSPLLYRGVTPRSPCGRRISSGFTVAAEIPSARAEFLTFSNSPEPRACPALCTHSDSHCRRLEDQKRRLDHTSGKTIV
jgi:hypothetical protein